MRTFNKDIFMKFSAIYMDKPVVDKNGTLKLGKDDLKQLTDMMHTYNAIVAKLDALESNAFVWGKNPFALTDSGMDELLKLRENKAEVLRRKVFFLNQKCKQITGKQFISCYVDPQEDPIPFAVEFCRCMFVPGAAV